MCITGSGIPAPGSDEEDLRLAREHADRSLALDPHSPDHLLIKGLPEVTGGSAVKSPTYFDAVLARDPYHEDALMWNAAAAMFLGLDVESKSRLERLRDVNPRNQFLLWAPTWIEVYAGSFASALEVALSSPADHQYDFMLGGARAMACAVNDHRQEAYDLIQASAASEPRLASKIIRTLGCAFIRDHDGVLNLLDSGLKRWAEKDFNCASWVADALAEVGEAEQSLDWLETSIERGNVNYPHLSELGPFLANLRGHQRFQALMDRVRPQWDALLANRAKRQATHKPGAGTSLSFGYPNVHPSTIFKGGFHYCGCHMKRLRITWQRLVDADGRTCDRCAATADGLQQALLKLQEALLPLGIEVEFEPREISEIHFDEDPSESNRIWIAGRPMEEWIGATVAESPCCAVCGDSRCRTIELGSDVFEAIPSELIVKAALAAAAQLVGPETRD